MTEPRTPLLCLSLNGPVVVRDGGDVFPEAVELMRRWKAGGGRIIAVSNQGDIALRRTTIFACRRAMEHIHDLTGRLFDKIAWCVHHPDAEHPEMGRCWCRMPSPGLLIETALDLAKERGEIYPPYMGLMVGARPEDEQCAALAGFDFTWAADWRGQV